MQTQTRGICYIDMLFFSSLYETPYAVSFYVFLFFSCNFYSITIFRGYFFPLLLFFMFFISFPFYFPQNRFFSVLLLVSRRCKSFFFCQIFLNSTLWSDVYIRESVAVNFLKPLSNFSRSIRFFIHSLTV